MPQEGIKINFRTLICKDAAHSKTKSIKLLQDVRYLSITKINLPPLFSELFHAAFVIFFRIFSEINNPNNFYIMAENQNSNAGQGLGIAGLVLGIIALIISFIPCLGVYALIPGIIAIVLSAIGFSQAKKVNAARGLVLAALIISILGTIIASWQLVTIKSASSKFENFGKELEKALEEELDEEDMKDLEEAMEELEGELEEEFEELNDEEKAKAVGEAAGKALKEFSDEMKKDTEDLEKQLEELEEKADSSDGQ